MTETPDITSTPLDWVGKTYIDRSDYWDIARGRAVAAPTDRFLIEAVEPCNEWYYKMTGADPAIPRWNVTCRKVRPGRGLGPVREFALLADAEVVAS